MIKIKKRTECDNRKCGLVIYGKTTDCHFCADCIEASGVGCGGVVIDGNSNLVIVGNDEVTKP